MIRVESQGSFWMFDEGAMRYCRMPKEEKPRDYEHWSDERAGDLQDFIWHDYLSWRIMSHCPTIAAMFAAEVSYDIVDEFLIPCLFIRIDEEGRGVHAPDAVIR